MVELERGTAVSFIVIPAFFGVGGGLAGLEMTPVMWDDARHVRSLTRRSTPAGKSFGALQAY
jgi:hypothetical protein